MRKSLVLLKNGKPTYAGGFLPLIKKQPKILVVGTHADNLGYQCGGWTIEWQGLSGNDLTIGTYILPMLYNFFPQWSTFLLYIFFSIRFMCKL